MDEDRKPSRAFKVFRFIAGCIVVIAIIPIAARLSTDGMHNLDLALLKGSEDDPNARNPQSKTNDAPPPAATQAAAVDQLDCGTEAAKQLALQVVKENPPGVLLDGSMGVTNLLTLNKSCENDTSKPNACDRKLDDIRQRALFSIKNIRLEARDEATGAIECNATLHVDLADNFGSGDEEISYKVEKMEDGGLHIDLAGLR